MKKLLCTLAMAVGIAMPSSAAITISNPGQMIHDISTVTNNDFLPTDTGYYSNIDTFWSAFDLTFSQKGTLEFYYIGAESGYENSFGIGDSQLYKETGGTNGLHGPNDIYIGSQWVTAGGTQADLWWFDNNIGGANNVFAVLGDLEFGAYFDAPDHDHDHDLDQNCSSCAGPLEVNELILAFDDNGAGPDDNHDDMLVRVVWTSAVPEPATWLMLILGFGMVGVATRRRKTIALS